MTNNELDKKALEISQKYNSYGNALLEIIIQIDQQKAFYEFGFNSLFSYVRERLKLSPAITYSFINVARKSIEVPKLKREVLAGNISISKAQKMTSVLNKNNQDHWLNLAKKETHRKLEREVALASPKFAIKEKAQYIASTTELKEKVKVLTKIPRIQLQMGVSEKLMLKLRRAQDLQSQKNKKNINLEETLDTLLDSYLNKYDPVKKAQRQKAKGKLQVQPVFDKKLSTNSSQRRVAKTARPLVSSKQSSERKPLPAKVVHQVQLRDQGQCRYTNEKGLRCSSQRFLEIHHIKPISQGGSDDFANLMLLCSGHHKALHRYQK